MINKIRDKNFYKLPLWKKQKKLERFLLEHQKCNVGEMILCFEDREKVSRGFERYVPKPKKLESFTVGKVYRILDKKGSEIKIEGDKGRKIWTTTERFLGQKALRKHKLEELEKKNKKYNINILSE